MKKKQMKMWLVVCVLILASVFVFYFLKNRGPADMTVARMVKPLESAVPDLASNNIPSPPLPTGCKPASQLTAAEKSSIEKRFNERMKPAIEKWAKAYAGHLPVSAADITFDKLYSIDSGPYGGFFTFMLGDTTFVFLDNRKQTKVFYLMIKQAARDFNTIPTDGKPRDLSVPITREEVLRMATADTGLHYELKDIVIEPTAAYCIIDGGANVEVGIKYKNGMALIAPDDLSFVMDSKGIIISYLH
jgi:hypothetical protein